MLKHSSSTPKNCRMDRMDLLETSEWLDFVSRKIRGSVWEIGPSNTRRKSIAWSKRGHKQCYEWKNFRTTRFAIRHRACALPRRELLRLCRREYRDYTAYVSLRHYSKSGRFEIMTLCRFMIIFCVGDSERPRNITKSLQTLYFVMSDNHLFLVVIRDARRQRRHTDSEVCDVMLILAPFARIKSSAQKLPL